MRIGIPNALLYHYYGAGWTSFLESLGIQSIVSEPTTGETVREGTYYADNETCLPVKVFVGHVMGLKESVDYILVPRMIRQSPGTKACPKYLGLPDIAGSLHSYVPKAAHMPEILSPRVDLGDKRMRWLQDWYDMARSLGLSDGLSVSAMRGLLARPAGNGEEVRPADVSPETPRVGVLGHRYSVYDPRISLDLMGLIRRAGAEPAAIEQVSRKHIRRQTRSLPRRINWDFENDFVGSALHWSRSGSVSGIIYAISFPCGPGSMISAFLEDQLGREGSVPFMTLALDEHSAETGLLTRVEAFIDMLKRRPGPRRIQKGDGKA
jgi:predicted nucleotide-binding protein (sugar kinase/HSP70/actin superfamily)